MVEAGRTKAARGCGGVPPPHGEKVWVGGCAPYTEFFFYNFGPQNGQFRCTVGVCGAVGDASPSSSPLDPPRVLSIE